jgi:hypothetical protein
MVAKIATLATIEQRMVAMSYVTKSNAQRAARKQFGANSREGHDWEIVSGRPLPNGKPTYDYAPGSKYDTPPAQRAWETAMGMRGYIGSPAHAEDVRDGRRKAGA